MQLGCRLSDLYTVMSTEMAVENDRVLQFVEDCQSLKENFPSTPVLQQIKKWIGVNLNCY